MAAPCLGTFGTFQYFHGGPAGEETPFFRQDPYQQFRENKENSGVGGGYGNHVTLPPLMNTEGHGGQQGAAEGHQLAGDNTVWVVTRYTPLDLRATAPVPRHKPLTPASDALPPPDPHWALARQQHPAAFTRDREETDQYRSTTSTRCEEWSTLRQMLPSRGAAIWHRPPNWGTAASLPPHRSPEVRRSFSDVSSPMSRFVDDMHKTNKLFQLF